MVSFLVSDTETLHGHRDYEQVVLDVNRSLKRFPPGIRISLSYVYLPPAYEGGVPLVLSLVLSKVMFQVLRGGRELEA